MKSARFLGLGARPNVSWRRRGEHGRATHAPRTIHRVSTLSEGPSAHPPDAVAEIERQMQWPVVAMLGFLAIMAAFLALALFSMRPLPPPLSGLPDDPDARAAAELLAGHARVSTPDLRMYAALLGGEAGASNPPPPDPARVAEAARRLEVAKTRVGKEPRLMAALGALELLRGHAATAERLYAPLTTHTRNFGEAHLGYAVALALRANSGAEELHGRGLLLQAIAHCAAVRPEDPAYPAAAYDRVVLLTRVGREKDARIHAKLYLERYPNGEWSDRLRAQLAWTGWSGSRTPPAIRNR